MYKGITVGAITTIGNKHVNRGTPCEDASFAVTKNGVSVVCIADLQTAEIQRSRC